MADDLNHDWYTITAWLAQDRVFMFKCRLMEQLNVPTSHSALVIDRAYDGMLADRDTLHDAGLDDETEAW